MTHAALAVGAVLAHVVPPIDATSGGKTFHLFRYCAAAVANVRVFAPARDSNDAPLACRSFGQFCYSLFAGLDISANLLQFVSCKFGLSHHPEGCSLAQSLTVPFSFRPVCITASKSIRENF